MFKNHCIGYLNIKSPNLSYPKFSTSGIIGLFIISPLLTIPYILKKSIQGNRVCQLLLSLLMGIICILAWTPRADLYRHYMTFFEIQNKSFDYVLTYYLRFDIFLLFFQYLSGKIGISFELTRMIFMSIGYFCMFETYNLIIQKNAYNRIQKIIIFLTIFFSVPFIQISYALRYGLAITLISYVAIKRELLKEKYISDYIVLLLALSIHFGSIWYISLILLTPLVPNNISKILYSLILIITILCSIFIVDLIKLLPIGVLGDHMIYMYTEGGASENHLIGRNIFGNLGEYINIISIIFFTVFLIFKIKFTEQSKLAYLLLLIWFFTLPLFEINRRVGVAVVIYLGITNVLNSLSNLKYCKIIAGWLVIGSMLTAIVNWRMYTVSNIYYIVTPLPIILLQKYDKNWCISNVDGNGEMKIYKR